MMMCERTALLNINLHPLYTLLSAIGVVILLVLEQSEELYQDLTRAVHNFNGSLEKLS